MGETTGVFGARGYRGRAGSCGWNGGQTFGTYFGNLLEILFIVQGTCFSAPPAPHLTHRAWRSRSRWWVRC